MRHLQRRWKLPLLLGAVLGILIVTGQPGWATAPPVTVMTRNLYIGADLTPLFDAILSGDQDALSAAVETIYAMAQASNFPARATAIAAEIAAAAPDLVGMQEVVTWTYYPEDGPPVVTADFLQLILDALQDAGTPYETAAAATGFDLVFGDIGLAVRDVILFRAGATPEALSLTNVQTGSYQARLLLPINNQIVEVPRQWAAADVTSYGRSFRFITTHLESAEPPLYPVNVRPIQALELLTGPARTPLPTIVLGDLNAEPTDRRDSAWILLRAFFKDAWVAAPDAGSGNTCCHPADLSDPGSVLEERIDLVFTRGRFDVLSAEVVGEEPADFTPVGVWPSDHAGVVVHLLPPETD